MVDTYSLSGVLRSSLISPLTHIFNSRRITSLRGTQPALSFAVSIKLACTRIVNDPIFSSPFALGIFGILPPLVKVVNIRLALLTRKTCRAIMALSILVILRNTQGTVKMITEPLSNTPQESNLDSQLIEAQTQIEQIKERIYTAMDELARWMLRLDKLKEQADPFKVFINNELEMEL
jgi:hypothetical protein